MDDDLELAAVDEILSQHSSHTPAAKPSTDVQQPAHSSMHQPLKASGSTITPTSIANDLPMAIDLTDEKPSKLAAKSQGTQPDTLVSSSYTNHQVNTSSATVDGQQTGQLASTSDRYTCSACFLA